MTLLQRLATVGFGRREEAPAPAPVQHRAPAEPQMPAPRQAPEAPRQPSPVHAEYAKRPVPQGYRPAAGQLDQHGRPAAARTEDDQLEIPAFLRRPAAG